MKSTFSCTFNQLFVTNEQFNYMFIKWFILMNIPLKNLNVEGSATYAFMFSVINVQLHDIPAVYHVFVTNVVNCTFYQLFTTFL